MDQKDKDSVYWIGVLLTGLTLGVVAGFVFGWSWDKRVGALSDVRFLDVSIAVGTIGAAIGASYTAFVTLKIASQAREERAKEKRELALEYLLTNEWLFELILIEVACVNRCSFDPKWTCSIEKFKSVYDQYLALDRGRLKSISPDLAKLIRDLDRKLSAFWNFKDEPNWLENEFTLRMSTAAHRLRDAVRFALDKETEDLET